MNLSKVSDAVRKEFTDARVLEMSKAGRPFLLASSDGITILRCGPPVMPERFCFRFVAYVAVVEAELGPQ